jgi:hypothetical protein
MSPVSGTSLLYEISLPSADLWNKETGRGAFDRLFNYQEAYVGVVPESVGVGSSGKMCDIAQQHLEAKATECSFTISHPVEIDSHSWLTYDATATIQSVQIKYRYYVYSDANQTFQIITWTLVPLFDHDAPVFDRIAQSFKMPK